MSLKHEGDTPDFGRLGDNSPSHTEKIAITSGNQPQTTQNSQNPSKIKRTDT
nr:hypothetical protein [Nostoc sp. EfeVER01]MDZ7945013.1 hypothetical protein [Nostoc sp. EfeVER01]